MKLAHELAGKVIGREESCRLKAYPDPIWAHVKRTAENWGQWGKPWTIGYGETEGVYEGMVWTQERADTALSSRTGYFLLGVLQRCPQLHLEPPERVAACVSLAYNIGLAAFGASTVRARTIRREYLGAADAFLLWNKAGGKVLRGLTNRRNRERALYLG
ncbi:MAG: lysozyme [Telluria sp.]